MRFPEVSTNNLEGYYRFDRDTAIDSSGNGNDGTVIGATFTTGVTRERSASFDGTNDEIDLPDLSVSETYPYSFACWCLTTVSGAIRRTVTEGNTANNNDYSILGVDASAFGAFISQGSGGAGEVTITDDVDLSDGAWHFIIGVANASNSHELFIDGVSQGTSTTTVAAKTHNATTIGALRRMSTIQFWSGRIAQVRIYSKALSQTEINRLYAMGRVPIPVRKVGHGI